MGNSRWRPCRHRLPLRWEIGQCVVFVFTKRREPCGAAVHRPDPGGWHRSARQV